jgi:hypothetical protein
MQASHKIAEEIYKEAQAEQAAAGEQAAGGEAASETPADAEKKDDKSGAVDADFEVVDEDK